MSVVPVNTGQAFEDSLLQNFCNLVPYGMATLRRDCSVLYANEWLTKYLQKDNLHFEDLTKYISELHRAHFKKSLESLNEVGQVFRIPHLLFSTAQGRSAWCDAEIVKLPDDCAPLYGVTFREASEIGFIKKDVAHMRKYLKAVAKAAPIPIICISAVGRVVLWNHASEKLFGWSEEEVMGKESPAIPSHEYSGAVDFYQRLQKGQTIKGEVVERQRKDGSRVKVSVWAIPLHDENKQLTQVVGLFFDVSYQTSVEAMLRAEKQLNSIINKEKTQFIANVSHDLRTPISCILGYAQLLRNYLEDPIMKEKACSTIEENGKYLLRLVDSILDLSKLDIGEVEINEREFDFTELAGSVINSLLPKAAEKKLQLNYKIAANVPRQIYSDPDRLQQIIFNLLGNAIKFTKSGHVELLIAVDEHSRDVQYLKVLVSDTGIGISGASQENLFSVFSQADSSISRNFGGSGLGLALSRRLANRLGGELRLVESDLDRGSTFELMVKTNLEKIADDSLTANHQPDSNIRSSSNRARVLVVDDYEDNRLVVTQLLRNSSLDVESVSSGIEALELVKKKRYDALLLDLQMPQLSGYETAQRLRKSGYTGSIIALTAHAMSFEKQKCLAGGFDAYLTKPVDRITIIDTIEATVSRPLN